MSAELGLYIHIPFCKAKCQYCDFNSFAGMESLMPAYFNALMKELEAYSGIVDGNSIKSIFIGGGTPSHADTKHIYDLLNLIMRKFKVLPGAEITIETNPGTLSYEKLAAYKISGINRLSIGLQAGQDVLLRTLGRIHTMEEFLKNLDLAKKAGFKNINADLIFGIPGQTLNDWATTIAGIIELDIPHLSCYSLKIEEGTPFWDKCEAGELSEAEDELDREMYHFAVKKLCKRKYAHYEISNFAVPGFECVHNMIYWKADRYIGAGAGAHSYFEGKRYNNIGDLNKYIEADGDTGKIIENPVMIDRDEEMAEYMFLGLRLTAGIDYAEFKNRFGRDVHQVFGDRIKRLLNKQLVELEGSSIRLSALGLDLANQAFMEFV